VTPVEFEAHYYESNESENLPVLEMISAPGNPGRFSSSLEDHFGSGSLPVLDNLESAVVLSQNKSRVQCHVSHETMTSKLGALTVEDFPIMEFSLDSYAGKIRCRLRTPRTQGPLK
jgi:hypothetical protein